MTDMFGWFRPARTKPEKKKNAGKQRKKDGMEQVLENESEEWKTEYRNRFGKLPLGWTGTSEDFKFRCREEGMKEPHHWNCWSSAWSGLAKNGLIVRTGDRQYPSSASRHSNPNDIWKKIA